MRELILPGVLTCVANVLTCCSPPEASIKRCSADVLASACSEGADTAWPGLGVKVEDSLVDQACQQVVDSE